MTTPIEITVLGASGATGRELTRQALDRGHRVVAIARTPHRIVAPDSPRLLRVAADVGRPDQIAEALRDRPIVVSALGVAKGDRPGALTAGARAVAAAGPDRVVWLGAFGTGGSAAVAGPLTRTLLRMLGDLDDKVTAERIILAAGGTLLHAGPLSDGPLSPDRWTAGLDEVPRRLFPARISRATVAAALLDEAEKPAPGPGIAVPLG
ncbi:flavin reductase [Actinoplanes sp. SE50]|uniref:NAD(P)-dependent oxidoreductase n=1 Tax=unclassified Actinoplanes TaxID=2626549 RepID=UPI00023ECCDA|nr:MULTISPECIES: NAD(P)-binding oxidoreductase [unclassified Actinoplanes]AEV84850.1 Flavin reductase [Actinoplanes sp. SE50/110]ATO83241.1 flavin reductase [Actinoplanes sp. SE50]SLM00648.1 flavin reductase [Actinoplanes sp. SE50/110]